MNITAKNQFEGYFEDIIGYAAIKEELYMILDMMVNGDKYTRIGAELPRGVILHGQPGIGKSMMAAAFMKASGRAHYVLRHNQPDASFVREIRRVFEEAAASGPSVILLDDMDKFVTSDSDNECFAALQACIDEFLNEDIFIIATANSVHRMPNSLLREGRFDRRIKMNFPKGKDAEDIICHCLRSKLVSDINCEDVTKMLYGKSCASLDSVLNTAAILAAYHGKTELGMEEIVSATLSQIYGISSAADDEEFPVRDRELVACHEAGHAVIAEAIKEGGVGLVSINAKDGPSKGLTLLCRFFERRPYHVLIALGGKAAAELKCGTVASGSFSDIKSALDDLSVSITQSGSLGSGLLCVADTQSDMSLYQQECAMRAEFERYFFKAKEIISQNREFLDAITRELAEKGCLLYSDIKRIRESVTVIPAVIG